MANRRFHQFQSFYEPGIVTVYAEVAIGASGAPTLTEGYGVASVARSDQGKYTVTLSDKFTKFRGLSVVQENATAQDLTFQLDDEDVDAATPVVKFICKAAATATDPTSGSKLWIKIELKNSSVTR